MSESNIKLSVIMPVFNAQETLEKAISSILLQTESNFEFIIVDDGSTDKSAQIVRKFSDSRIKFVEKKHRGIVDSLNLAISESNSEFIARMDADDISHPERLKKQVTFLETNSDIGVVSCLVDFASQEKNSLGYSLYVDWINSLLTPEEISINRFIESPIAHPSVLFRRSLINLFGGYKNGEFPEDYELWLRLMHNNVKVAKVPETLFSWNDTPQRLSRTDKRYSLRNFYKCKAEYLAEWLHSNNPLDPYIYICGSGRETRKRADFLLNYGIKFKAYIDVDPKKTGKIIHGIPVIEYNSIPSPKNAFVVPFVGTRGAREATIQILEKAGFQKGKSYILGA